MKRGTTHWNSQLGTHFTSEPGTAMQFAASLGHRAPSGRVITARLHIENPKVYGSKVICRPRRSSLGWIAGLLQRPMSPGRWTRCGVPSRPARIRRALARSLSDNATSLIQTLGRKRPRIATAYKNALLEQGHDGVIYGNTVEGGFGEETAIAFDPSTIEVVDAGRGAPSAMAAQEPPELAMSERLRESPTLQEVAADSSDALHEALTRAHFASDQGFGPGDRRTVEGFASRYTDAVIGLASNDEARLAQAGLTPMEAAVERERALDILARTHDEQALYEAEAAWATLSGPGLPPTAPAATEPPLLSRTEFEATGEVLHHGTSRPFDRFDPAARTNAKVSSGGFFFTDDTDVARRFAHEGGRRTENISVGTVMDAAEQGRSIGDLDDIINRDDGLDLEGLQAAAQRRLDQGFSVYRVSDETGDLVPLTDPSTLTGDDLESGVTVYQPGHAPRTITATVYGDTLDLRRASGWPEDLVEQLRQSTDRWDQRLYDAWSQAANDNYPGPRRGESWAAWSTSRWPTPQP